jgi:hypothetical protein
MDDDGMRMNGFESMGHRGAYGVLGRLGMRNSKRNGFGT